MEHLFDSNLRNTTHLRHKVKTIAREHSLSFSRLLKQVIAALDGDLGKVWQRRRKIKFVLDTYGINDQRSLQWIAKRGEMLTASEITKAFRSASPSARYELFLRKIVGPKPMGADLQPKALIWGTQFESVAKGLYETFEGVKIVDTSCVKHPKHSFLGASPDGIILTPDPMDSRWGTLVEFKCPISRQFKDDSPIPEYYWHQMQMQMECTGVDHCTYIEFRFEQLPHTKWVESTSEHKGAYIIIDDTGEVVYKPQEIDYMTWIRKHVNPNFEDYQTVFWALAQWRKVPVPRDFTWMPTHLDELTAFWNEVLQHRSAGTLPANPSPANTLVLDLSGAPCIDSPDGVSVTPPQVPSAGTS
jgi:putative phage-type endonuclease